MQQQRVWQVPEKRANEVIPWKLGGRPTWPTKTYQFEDKNRQHFVYYGSGPTDWSLTILKDGSPMQQ